MRCRRPLRREADEEEVVVDVEAVDDDERRRLGLLRETFARGERCEIAMVVQ